MKRLHLINEWNSLPGVKFFSVVGASVSIEVGKVSLFSFMVAPGMGDTTYISVVVLGFGFSLLVGTPRNRTGIFR